MEACENCTFSADYGDSVLYIRCEMKKIHVKKQEKCACYKPDLAEENKQLKRAIADMREAAKFYMGELERLQQENNELKKERAERIGR